MKVSIDSNKKLYAVIGDPISHSLSPIFQNYFINKKDINAIYLPLKIKTTGLAQSMDLLRDNFHGFNVTLPHKESIIPYLDKIDPLALEYGAVNTVANIDGKLIGYNTDGIGFTKSLKEVNINMKNKDILLLGAGGAGRVIASEIIKSGGKLTIANRSIDRANNLKKELESIYKTPVVISKLDSIDKAFHMVINTTSVGMDPHINISPVGKDILKNTEVIYDVIYNPFKTKLLKIGEEFGARTINGLPMLIYQGLESFKIWSGIEARSSEEKDLYNMLKNKLMEDK